MRLRRSRNPGELILARLRHVATANLAARNGG
jgi:hypothetical protein